MPATGWTDRGVRDLVPATGIKPWVWVPQDCGVSYQSEWGLNASGREGTWKSAAGVETMCAHKKSSYRSDRLSIGGHGLVVLAVDGTEHLYLLQNRSMQIIES